jgi:hypothetical protein
MLDKIDFGESVRLYVNIYLLLDNNPYLLLDNNLYPLLDNNIWTLPYVDMFYLNGDIG